MYTIIRKFCNFLFGKHKNNTLPRIWILAADMVIVVLAFLIAITMLYFRNFSNSFFDWSRIWIVPFTYLIAFLVSRTYDGMLRYSGFNDVRKILYSCSAAVAFLVISKLIISQINTTFVLNVYPRYTVIIYHYLITMVMMVIMRLTIRRLYNEIYKYSGKKKNTIIYGAGDGGTMLLRTLSQDTASDYTIKAFVDDDQRRVGNQINTVKSSHPR